MGLRVAGHLAVGWSSWGVVLIAAVIACAVVVVPLAVIVGSVGLLLLVGAVFLALVGRYQENWG